MTTMQHMMDGGGMMWGMGLGGLLVLVVLILALECAPAEARMP
jgi:hypothetical protein